MHKSWLVIISLAVVIVVLTVALIFLPKPKKLPDVSNLTTPSPVPVENPTAEKNITVSSPTNNQTIGKSLTIAGSARVFENVVNYAVKDSSGNLLASGTTVADAEDVGLFGPFSVTVNYTKPKTSYGVVEVFWASPKDGEPLDKTIIFVKLPEASSF